MVSEFRRRYGLACAANATGSVLAVMDGDSRFLPTELPALLAPLEQGQADLALGSRTLNVSQPLPMPSHQRLGNHLFIWLLRQRFGLAITDLGSFRAIRRELLLALEMCEFTYGWPLEMIIKPPAFANSHLEFFGCSPKLPWRIIQ